MVETMNSPRTAMNSREAILHGEGSITRSLENQAARMPSDLWLFAALGSMGVSLALRSNGYKDESLFVGQWAAPFLLIGVYNKLVKIAGSDRVQRAE